MDIPIRGNQLRIHFRGDTVNTRIVLKKKQAFLERYHHRFMSTPETHCITSGGTGQERMRMVLSLHLTLCRSRTIVLVGTIHRACRFALSHASSCAAGSSVPSVYVIATSLETDKSNFRTQVCDSLSMRSTVKVRPITTCTTSVRSHTHNPVRW